MKKFESRPEITKIGISDYRELKSTANKLRLLPGVTVTDQELSTDLSFTKMSETTGVYTHNLFRVDIHTGEVPQINQHTLSVIIACYGLSNIAPLLIYKRSVNIKVAHGEVERAWQTTEIPPIDAPPEAQPNLELDFPVRALFEEHDRALKAGWLFGPAEARYLLAELDLIAQMDMQI